MSRIKIHKDGLKPSDVRSHRGYFGQRDGTVIEYPNTGYIVTENGEITLPDGTLPAPGVAITISPEHMKIAIERKKRAAERGE